MSSTYFDNISQQNIALSHLKFENENEKNFYFGSKYFDSYKMEYEKKKEKNKSDKIIEKEVSEEICEKSKKLKEDSLKFYKIEDIKNKELENTFKNSKLKVYLKCISNLENGKICGNSGNKCSIYECMYFNKLYDIKNIIDAKSIIELDNNDLIIFKYNIIFIFID